MCYGFIRGEHGSTTGPRTDVEANFEDPLNEGQEPGAEQIFPEIARRDVAVDDPNCFLNDNFDSEHVAGSEATP